MQFRSDFKDARRDVTTKRACSGTVPTRTHDARSSPAVNASLPVHPQRSCAADLRVHRCHGRGAYLTGKDTHAHRSRAASDAVAEPKTQLEPVPASCSAPLASPESLPHPRTTTGGEVPPAPGSLRSPWGCADGAATQRLAPALPARRSVHATLLVPDWRRDACRDHRESTAILVMEIGLWRASASRNEAREMLGNSYNRRKHLPLLRARAPGKGATCLHRAITFSVLQ